ncbi:8-amino-7-oxononanoate synthase, partial [Nocardioidaceae bacterium Broad-1]
NTEWQVIFDHDSAPVFLDQTLAAERVARSRPDLAGTIRARVTGLARTLGVASPAGAVLSVPMPSPEAAVAAQADLLTEGVRVGCFRPPSVPDGVSRLRVTAGAGVTDEDWDRAVKAIDTVVGETR